MQIEGVDLSWLLYSILSRNCLRLANESLEPAKVNLAACASSRRRSWNHPCCCMGTPFGVCVTTQVFKSDGVETVSWAMPVWRQLLPPVQIFAMFETIPATDSSATYLQLTRGGSFDFVTHYHLARELVREAGPLGKILLNPTQKAYLVKGNLIQFHVQNNLGVEGGVVVYGPGSEETAKPTKRKD